MIYFDYTATVKPKVELVELHNKITNEYWANSETLSKEGMKANSLYQDAEKNILNSLGLKNHYVLFTSGATEANNTAIYSICKPHLKEPKHIITTCIEHSSVLNCFKDLEKNGFNVTYLSVNNEGIINLEELKNAMTKDTILVSIMHVNNITGVIEPIKEVIDIIKDYPRCKLHVDTVQSLGKLNFNFNLNDVDMFTYSSHKLGGLKGEGALVYKNNLTPEILQGGHQQRTFRPGTLDLAGCVVTSKALSLSLKDIDESYKHVKELHDYLINELKQMNHLVVNAASIKSPYIISICFKNLKGETALHMLDELGFVIGTGSACNAKSKNIEGILKYTLDKDLNPINACRISLAKETTKEDVNALLEALKKIGK